MDLDVYQSEIKFVVNDRNDDLEVAQLIHSLVAAIQVVQ